MPAPDTVTASSLPPAAAVVLLVSADEALVSQVRAMVTPDRSIAIHHCASVGDAEIEVLEIHPTLVMLDLDIRGRTPALDLLRRLRRQPEASALPVMVLGSPGESQLRAAVFDALPAQACRNQRETLQRGIETLFPSNGSNSGFAAFF